MALGGGRGWPGALCCGANASHLPTQNDGLRMMPLVAASGNINPTKVRFVDFDKSTVERFWGKVDIRGDNECWPWLLCKTPPYGRHKGGYGRFTINGRQSRANRVALIIATGEDRASELACHRCDNPACCNPNHLFWGSTLENNRDCRAKGRYRHRAASGQENGKAKLLASQVDYIRLLLDAGYKPKEIGAWYGVTRSTIGDIKTGRCW